MIKKSYILPFFVFLILTIAGFLYQEIGQEREELREEQIEEPKLYVLFTLNVHDWVFDEKSAATVQRVVEIHEKYNIPVDIYLNDQMVQLYTKEYPELIEILKTSSYSAVSYHIRPPAPYYTNFDFLGLNELDEEELYETLKEYEEHALDIVNGMPTEEQGGYEYLKKVLGYAPPVVNAQKTDGIVGKTLSKIYKEKGAIFDAVHNKVSILGEKSGELFARPEDVEIKLYDSFGKDPEMIVTTAITDTSTQTTRDIFINIKMHENNFYAKRTPWAIAYFQNWNKSIPLLPPFDLSGLGDEGLLKKEMDEEETWIFYEETVKYISEHSEFTTINAFDLVEMVEL